jgi:hypothetical protein
VDYYENSDSSSINQLQDPVSLSLNWRKNTAEDRITREDVRFIAAGDIISSHFLHSKPFPGHHDDPLLTVSLSLFVSYKLTHRLPVVSMQTLSSCRSFFLTPSDESEFVPESLWTNTILPL